MARNLKHIRQIEVTTEEYIKLIPFIYNEKGDYISPDISAESSPCWNEFLINYDLKEDAEILLEVLKG